MKKTILITITIMMMLFGLCACGESEEVVEITSTAPPETEADRGDSKSDYEKIYKEYSAKMEEAAKIYIEELEAEVKGASKDELYDLTKEKTDKLNEIREEGNGKMTDVMLASAEDDQEEYEKWFKKLGTSFSELSREITAVYTEQF